MTELREEIAGLLMNDDCFHGEPDDALDLAGSILGLPKVQEALALLESSGKKCDSLLDEIRDLHEEEARPFEERFGYPLPPISTNTRG